MGKMPFASKTDRYATKKKLIGVYMDKSIARYLSLYALWKDTTVSGVLRDLIYTYVKDKEKVEYMLNEIAKKAHDEWLEWYDRNMTKGIQGWRTAEQVGNRWDEFREQAESNLMQRRVDVKFIESILEKMQNLEIKRGLH